MTDTFTEYLATKDRLNAQLNTTWHAIVNVATEQAIVPDGLAMVPGPVYAAMPEDLDRADWRDGGREFDAMLWVIEGNDIEGSVQIRNKKSGLWLGGWDAANATLKQVATPVYWHGVMMNGGVLQIFWSGSRDTAGKVGPAGDSGRLGQVGRIASYPRGKVQYADDTPDLKGDLFLWEFRRLDYHSHAYAAFDLKKANGALGAHARNLNIAAKVAKTFATLAKNIGDISGQKDAGAAIASVFTVVEGVTTFVGDLLGIEQARRNSEVDDPTVQLYEALLPEISRIIEEKIGSAFIEQNIGTAMGMDKSGRDHLNVAAKLIKKRVDPLTSEQLHHPSPSAFAEATNLTSPAQLFGDDYKAICDELDAAANYLSEARNYLFERLARYAYFPVWMSIAVTDLRAQTLRALVDPEGRGQLARVAIEQLAADAAEQYQELSDYRMGMIDDQRKVDAYYRMGREFSLQPTEYRAFVKRMLDQSFGNPPAYLAQIDQIMEELQQAL